MGGGAMKVISGMECYNEPQEYTGGTEYVNCFYSNLFSYLLSNRKDILPFIANNVFYYNYTPEATDMREKYGIIAKPAVNTDKLALEQGVEIGRENIGASTISDFIKNHINLAEPVSVAVDMFELSYRKDRYQKIHTLHYFMIYGYDDSEGLLYILDNPTNKEYKKVTCSYEDFERGYRNAKNLSSQIETMYFRLIDDNSLRGNEQDLKQVFIKNYLSLKRHIFSNLESLVLLKSDFEDICKKELFTERGTNLFYLIHYHIMNKKRAELFAYYKILEDMDVVNSFGEIVRNWERVRNILNYCLNSGKMDVKKIDSAVEEIEELRVKEKMFYGRLFEGMRGRCIFRC